MTSGHLPTSTKYMPGELIPGTGLKIAHWLEDGIDVTEQDINRWKMAKRAAELRPGSDEAKSYNGYNEPFRRRCSDLPDIGDILNRFPIAVGFGAAAMVHGGLHALAWNAHFDSPIQQLLWRLSACVVMGGIPTIFVILSPSLKITGKRIYWFPWGQVTAGIGLSGNPSLFSLFDGSSVLGG